MSDITHSDYCPVNNTGPLEDCVHCLTEQQRTQDYWRAQYLREHHPTREEIEDCYSDPTERSKRDILIERLGL